MQFVAPRLADAEIHFHFATVHFHRCTFYSVRFDKLSPDISASSNFELPRYYGNTNKTGESKHSVAIYPTNRGFSFSLRYKFDLQPSTQMNTKPPEKSTLKFACCVCNYAGSNDKQFIAHLARCLDAFDNCDLPTRVVGGTHTINAHVHLTLILGAPRLYLC
jgi:hypothetical protein